MIFLVERYLPPAAAQELAASVARVARLSTDSGRSGIEVEYLSSVYLPTEDTCFCLFRAHSPDAVRAVNATAEFALDRITEKFGSGALTTADLSEAPARRKR